MNKRVQMTRARKWRDRHPEAVIVDRRSKWGNQFKAGEGAVPDAATAAQMFERDLSETWRAAARADLRGRNLACWCKLCDRHKDGLPLGETCPDCAPCHADVLLRVANEGDRE